MSGIEILEQQMELYHSIFLVCFVLFLTFVILDLYLFWRLKISRVFGYLTGKTAKKTIEEMMLRDGESKKRAPIMTPSGQMKKPGYEEIMLSAGRDMTGVLERTSFPDPSIYEKEEKWAGQKNTVYGPFEIVKKTILIHTEEQI